MATQRGDECASTASRPAHELLGRDNPAGRLIYNLYGNANGDLYGRKAGCNFSQRNRRAHDAKLATGWVPPPVEAPKPKPAPKPQVRVPKVGRYHHEEPKAPHIPTRKPLEAIQLERERDRALDKSTVPVPSGPLLDDEEKQRLATLMQYRGKVPQVAPKKAVPVAPKSEREMLEELFEQVVREVDERKAFLEEMTRQGRAKEFSPQIQGEVAERIREMARLDKLIKTCPG